MERKRPRDNRGPGDVRAGAARNVPALRGVCRFYLTLILRYPDQVGAF